VSLPSPYSFKAMSPRYEGKPRAWFCCARTGELGA
jgi:hypothetical protein